MVAHTLKSTSAHPAPRHPLLPPVPAQALKANPECAPKDLKLGANYITKFGQVGCPCQQAVSPPPCSPPACKCCTHLAPPELRAAGPPAGFTSHSSRPGLSPLACAALRYESWARHEPCMETPLGGGREVKLSVWCDPASVCGPLPLPPAFAPIPFLSIGRRLTSLPGALLQTHAHHHN